MTILVDNQQPYAVHIHIDDENWKSFQELVQRGSNLWPDAPPEIKEFADMVTSGMVMQDYYRQADIRRCVCGVMLKGGVTHMNCTAGVATDQQTNKEQPK